MLLLISKFIAFIFQFSFFFLQVFAYVFIYSGPTALASASSTKMSQRVKNRHFCVVLFSEDTAQSH